MNIKTFARTLCVLAACAIASGCDKLGGMGATGCTSADTSQVVIGIVEREVTDGAATKESEDAPTLTKSKIRASVKQLKMTLEDVRTSKDDPNSSKKFCVGTLKVVAPAEMVEDADQARQMAGLNSVEEMADAANVTKEANVFTAEIEYNVQPTDDGDKVFAEIESGEESINFLALMVQNHLLRSAVADAKAESDRVEAEQRAAEENATREYAAASLEEAKANNQMAIQSINATWKALPEDVRGQLLPMQKAWQKKKDATCRLEASQNAASEADMAVARLNCDTREQNSRADYLRQVGQQAIANDAM